MDPTPVTIVHARPGNARPGRRPGVVRAWLVGLAVGVVLASSAGGVRAAQPTGAIEPTASPTLPPGQEKKQTPVPGPTPAPATNSPAEPASQPPLSESATPVVSDGAPAPTVTADPVAVSTAAPSPEAPAAPSGTSETRGSAATDGAGSSPEPTGLGGEAPLVTPTAATAGQHTPAAGASTGAGSIEDAGRPDGPLAGGTDLPGAVGGGILVGVAVVAGATVLLVIARRRRAPVAAPVVAEPVDIPQQPDHEQLLAAALGRGRRAGAGDGPRPAWLRRLDPGPMPTVADDAPVELEEDGRL